METVKTDAAASCDCLIDTAAAAYQAQHGRGFSDSWALQVSTRHYGVCLSSGSTSFTMQQTMPRVADPKIRYIGVIGDVHAHHEALESAGSALKAAGAEAVVCVGDIYGPGDGTAACCKTLKQMEISAVRGNHDRWIVAAAECDPSLLASIGSAAVSFLSSLPVTLRLDSVDGSILLCHGVGPNDLAHLPQSFPDSFARRAVRVGLIPPGCSVVIHGHSHVQRERRCGDIHFITVGPLSSRPTGGCLIFDALTDSVMPVIY